jgi:hypothetical protein
MQRILFFCVFVAGCLCLPVCFKRWTCGFKLSKVEFTCPKNPQWDVAQDLGKQELLNIVSQPFVYLNRGAQSYVFVSFDGQYVLKLFRSNPKLFHRGEMDEIAKTKIDRLFNACTLAYTKAKNETGLVFLHLNRTENSLPMLHIRDPIGRPFTLPLDAYHFAIQKKATLFRDSFALGDEADSKQRIDSFVALLRSRAEKGIANTDPTVSRNFGFLGTQAVEIDFGNYTEELHSKEREVARYASRVYMWLIDFNPQLAEYLKTSLQECEREELQIHQDLLVKEK